MRKLKTSVALAAVGSVLALAATSTASAAPAPISRGGWSPDRTLSSGSGAVFQIARHKGTVFFTDGVAGTVSKINKRGKTVVVSHIPDVAGLEFNGKSRATASGSGPGSVVRITRPHHRAVVAHVGQYEQNVNPDRNVTYGITTGASPACKAELETTAPGGDPAQTRPATYKGLQDSHPYQLAALPRGAFAVAEAAGNAILRVGKLGKTSTIALLPPQPIDLSVSQANMIGAPDCAGETYAFEPVPTDVERVGKTLWVTVLPGHLAADPRIGDGGSIYKIKGGVVTKVARFFGGATNLAVHKGRIYVAEFDLGHITKLGKGGRFTRALVEGAVSVEVTAKKLYIGTVGTGPSSPGKVIRIPRKR